MFSQYFIKAGNGSASFISKGGPAVSLAFLFTGGLFSFLTVWLLGIAVSLAFYFSGGLLRFFPGGLLAFIISSCLSLWCDCFGISLVSVCPAEAISFATAIWRLRHMVKHNQDKWRGEGSQTILVSHLETSKQTWWQPVSLKSRGQG